MHIYYLLLLSIVSTESLHHCSQFWVHVMSHVRADDTCKSGQWETIQHSQHSPSHPVSSQCGYLIFQVTEYLLCKVPWLQAGVCRLTSGGSDYSSDSSDQCPPPLLLSTGPSHHRDTESAPSAIVTNTNHQLGSKWCTLIYFASL